MVGEPVGTECVIGPKEKKPLRLEIPILVSDIADVGPSEFFNGLAHLFVIVLIFRSPIFVLILILIS